MKISEAVFHWSVWHFQEKAVIRLLGKIIGGLVPHRCTVPLKRDDFLRVIGNVVILRTHSPNSFCTYFVSCICSFQTTGAQHSSAVLFGERGGGAGAEFSIFMPSNRPSAVPCGREAETQAQYNNIRFWGLHAPQIYF